MSSPQIDALAEQFGASAALIERSAAARAAATGATVEAVLAGWTGGEAPPPPPAPAPAPVETEPEPPAPEEPVAEETPVEETEEEPAPAEPTVADEPPPVPVAAASSEPDRVPSGSLSLLLMSAIALAAAMFVATVVAPSSGGNALTLDAVETIVLSDAAEAGREVYLAEGCAECHTQQVRPVVADADLGTITLSASPLIPGNRRIGPDLSHVGSREPTNSASWLMGFLSDPGEVRSGSDHPSYGYLSASDLDDLTAYLLESK